MTQLSFLKVRLSLFFKILYYWKENMGALSVKFSVEELQEFRTAFEKIPLVEVSVLETALTDR